MSCAPSPPVTVVQPTSEVTQPDTLDVTDTVEESYTEPTEQEVTVVGEAFFFKDSLAVTGDGFEFRKQVPYSRVLILFDEDGKISKVETLTGLPFKQVDKNTIYLLKGANLTLISRHFGIPIDRLTECNPKIKDRDHIPALTRLKLNCKCDK